MLHNAIHAMEYWSTLIIVTLRYASQIYYGEGIVEPLEILYEDEVRPCAKSMRWKHQTYAKSIKWEHRLSSINMMLILWEVSLWRDQSHKA